MLLMGHGLLKSYRSAARPLMALFVCLAMSDFVYADTVNVTRYVGQEFPAGVVVKPNDYLNAVAPLYKSQYDFDDGQAGESLNYKKVGDVTLRIGGFHQIVLRQNLQSGALPSSAPLAAELSSDGMTIPKVEFKMEEPVISFGLVLMGTTEDFDISIKGPDFKADYFLPGATTSASRRWVSVMTDARYIETVSFAPRSSVDFAFDDMEIGVHAPEPVALTNLLLGIILLLPKRYGIVGRGRQYADSR